MLKNIIVSAFVLLAATAAHADVDIVGTVSSNCVIQNDTAGVYGNRHRTNCLRSPLMVASSLS